MDIQQKNNLAQRVAHDIPEGSYVNLGIGLPTLVADYFADKEVILQSENGVLGQWTQAEAGEENWDLINETRDATGRLTKKVTDFDNGDQRSTLIDVDDEFAWESYSRTFDHSCTLISEEFF